MRGCGLALRVRKVTTWVAIDQHKLSLVAATPPAAGGTPLAPATGLPTVVGVAVALVARWP
jgi:hypothetical protein